MPNRLRPKYVSVWLSNEGRAVLDARAKRAGTSRSDLLRRLLAYAVAHMPEGWKP